MKCFVRNNTFETNSSSTHSLSIFYKDGVDLVAMLRRFDESQFDIDVGEFGWEHEEYTDSYQILTYLWTYVSLYAKDYIEKLRELMPRTNFIEPTYDSDGWCNNGYIDHGNDWYDLTEVFESEYSLAQALFSSRLATSNDNSDYGEDFLEPSGAIKIYYKGN